MYYIRAYGRDLDVLMGVLMGVLTLVLMSLAYTLMHAASTRIHSSHAYTLRLTIYTCSKVVSNVEDMLLDIIRTLRSLAPERKNDALTALELDAIWRRHNRGVAAGDKRLSKRNILPYYQRIKSQDPQRWESWHIDSALESRLLRSIRMKPRRTASGVATITVITKPHPCSSNCIYCPNDLRMPKSYLSNEPACQRAELCFFDPYLQVATRLRALSQMGHAIDKLELIVLGGTWSDYPQTYQYWFIHELFRAANEWPVSDEVLNERRAFWRGCGLTDDADKLAELVQPQQSQVLAAQKNYNQAFHELYHLCEDEQHGTQLSSLQDDKQTRCSNSNQHNTSSHHLARTWAQVNRFCSASYEELKEQQKRNESANQRVVGLVIETRPDTISPQSLTLIRQLGCTKIQIGIQSTRQSVLDACQRTGSVEQVQQAFQLMRLFGFKIHSHLMLNLPSSTPAQDKDDFKTLVTDSRFIPDEIKLYPCALVDGTGLVERYRRGEWRPYTLDELVDVLVDDVLATPPQIRISRMIRDISASDIMVGNKHANLRQLVEQRIQDEGQAGHVHEIRFREIALDALDLNALEMKDVSYTCAMSHEHFLQWVTPEDRIAGFCRLSLPLWEKIDSSLIDQLPVKPGQAMIREVHVYGQVAHLGQADARAQHQGLGRRLIERACAIAQHDGYDHINVISSIGTRGYYRKLGFVNEGLYQRKAL